jgi:hypothetical protein
MSRLHTLWTLSALALCAAAAWAAEVDRYVPADATAVASVNVRQLLDAPLVRPHAQEAIRAVLAANAGLQDVLTAAGIDPLRDVTGVVLAARGTKPEQALLIVHGKFDDERARRAAADFAREHPTQLLLHKEGDAVVYENRSAKRPTFAAFADAETVVAALGRGPVAAAVRGGTRPVKLRPDVQALVSKADGTKSAWLVALAPPELRKQLAQSANAANVADRIRACTATLDVDRDVQVAVDVLTTDARTANSVAEMLDGLRNLGKLMAQNQPDFGDLIAQVFEGVKVRAGKNTVEVRARVPGEMIEKALQKAPKEKPREP